MNVPLGKAARLCRPGSARASVSSSDDVGEAVAHSADPGERGRNIARRELKAPKSRYDTYICVQ